MSLSRRLRGFRRLEEGEIGMRMRMVKGVFLWWRGRKLGGCSEDLGNLGMGMRMSMGRAHGSRRIEARRDGIIVA